MKYRTLLAAAAAIALVGCENDRNNNTRTRSTPSSQSSGGMYGAGTTGSSTMGGSSGSSTGTGTGMNGSGGSTGSSGSRGGGFSQGQSSAINEMDRTFVREAAGGGMFEVQSAQLALDQTSDPKLQQISQMLIDDHTRANQELMGIANQVGINAPTALPSKYQSMIDQLRAKQGNNFTQQFKDQQVQAHVEAIELFEREVRDGQNPQLKSFAQRTLPKLRQHLDEVRNYQPPGGSQQPSSFGTDVNS